MDGMTYWFRYSAEPKAVPFGRQFAANVLRDWNLEHLTESVTLIVSELVTNAVRATGTTKPEVGYQERELLPFVAVRLRVSDLTLVVEVWDDSRALPRMRTPEPDAEDGRGLSLVQALSLRWDSHRHPSGGKVVYAVLPLMPAPVAVADAQPEPLPGRVRKPRGEPGVRPDAALLTRLEHLLERRFRRLVAFGV
ncbi:ATP-binding protein [Streptomyces lunaelactis]|uniref:ATP-binding protein n=1 Tax=Streptomyces lunaelactis TaxID=1535768 RepID=UPI001584E5D8|nr:ATP-binding protein [Streptomyces lunaelactis]NUK27011.1 ATP-binding protein [Streptomyces lunaelactis]